MIKKFLFYLLGVIAFCYLWATLIYGIGFFLNSIVPKSIDSGTEGPIFQSIIINILLLSAFGIQHSVMARKRFKKWWTKFIPQPIERSVYAIFSSAIIWLSMMYWQPMTGIVWDFQNIFIQVFFYTLFFLGAGITVYAIIVLDLLDYVGLRQIHLHFQPGGYVPLKFKTPSIYKHIRHPMVVGVCTFFWATPKMTIGHFIFAAGMTIYSFIGLQFEERNLISEHGEKYEKYKKTVRAILPLPKTSY